MIQKLLFSCLGTRDAFVFSCCCFFTRYLWKRYYENCPSPPDFVHISYHYSDEGGRFRPPHDYLPPPQIFKHSAGSSNFKSLMYFVLSRQNLFRQCTHLGTYLVVCLLWRCKRLLLFIGEIVCATYVCTTTYKQGCRKPPKHTGENPINWA